MRQNELRRHKMTQTSQKFIPPCSSCPLCLMQSPYWLSCSQACHKGAGAHRGICPMLRLHSKASSRWARPACSGATRPLAAPPGASKQAASPVLAPATRSAEGALGCHSGDPLHAPTAAVISEVTQRSVCAEMLTLKMSLMTQ